MPVTSRNQILIGISALIVIAVAAGIAVAMRTSSAERTQWLITHGSASATLTGEPGSSGSLVLSDPDASVLLFTDRPERRTATMALIDLAQQWEDVFASSSPNAALVDDTTGDAMAVLTLGQPTVSADTVTFPVTIIDARRDSGSDRVLGQVHLFIDPPAARLTDFHETPMVTPAGPGPIPYVGGPSTGSGAPTMPTVGPPAS